MMSGGPILEVPQDVALKLRERIAKKTVVAESGCIEWIGTIDTDGYGVTGFSVNGKRRAVSAHRASWMVHKGPIPKGFVLDHLCRVRNCVNVDHLEPVTTTLNTARGAESRRSLPPIERRPAWVDVELWREARVKAAAEGVTIAEVVSNTLRLFVGLDKQKQEDES